MITFDDPQVAAGRILVVDDNEPSATLVRALLERAGASNIRVVTDSVMVFEQLDDFHPDLLILDLHMPRVDGYAVLNRLRAQRTAATPLPVMVLTADTTRDAVHLALTLGATEFLTKPVDAVELTLRVRNQLKTRIQQEGLRRRQRWLAAATALTESLLASDCADPLQRVCDLAREAAEAELAVISDVTDGRSPLRSGCGQPVSSGSTVIIRAGIGVGHRQTGRLELHLAEPHQLVRTTQTLAENFAAQAAVALELAATRIAAEREQVLSDRRRIARELHDQTIQRLFATGLRLQNAAGAVEDGTLALKLTRLAGQLDDAMTEIRTAIDDLRGAGGTEGPLESMLAELCTELADVLGFEPTVTVTGDDAPLDPILVADLMAVAREALTNVARHAHAGTTAVAVHVTTDEVELTVDDDGVGQVTTGRRSGLANMAERAGRHAGRAGVESRDGGGTRVIWLAHRNPGR